MLTKTKIVLAAALVAVTASAASAQGFDPNLANRYPAYAAPVASAQIAPATRGALQSAPVRLNQGSGAALNGQFVPKYDRRVPGNQGDTSYGQDWAQSYGGGF